jgi:hypothetical protein
MIDMTTPAALTIDWSAHTALSPREQYDAAGTVIDDAKAAAAARRARIAHDLAQEHGAKGAARILGISATRVYALAERHRDSQARHRRGNAMTTTAYGSFALHCPDASTTRTLHDYVATALGDHADDYDIDALADAYRDAVNRELEPTGVALRGDEFYGPHPVVEVDFAAAFEAVDFWSLAAEHDRG